MPTLNSFQTVDRASGGNKKGAVNLTRLIYAVNLCTFLPLTACAQTQLDENLRSGSTDTPKWMISAQEDTITQGNKLIFSIKKLPPSPYYYGRLYGLQKPTKG